MVEVPPPPFRLAPVTRKGKKVSKEAIELARHEVSEWKVRLSVWKLARSAMQQCLYGSASEKSFIAKSANFFAALAGVDSKRPSFDAGDLVEYDSLAGYFRDEIEQAYVVGYQGGHWPKREKMEQSILLTGCSPIPMPPLEAMELLLTQPSESARLRILRTTSSYSGPQNENMGEWIEPLVSPPAPNLNHEPDRSERTWALTTDATGCARVVTLPSAPSKPPYGPRHMTTYAHGWIWEALQPMWARVADTWMMEAQSDGVEMTAPLAQVLRWRRVTGETTSGWIGQTANAGEWNLQFPHSRAWLQANTLPATALAESTKSAQVAQWRLMVWEHSRNVVEPAVILDQIRTMSNEEMGAVFRNATLPVESRRLIRNWALFDLLQVGAANRNWSDIGTLSADILNSMAYANFPLPSEELERIEHALRFSAAPVLRSRLAAVREVVQQPWAVPVLFAHRKNTISDEVCTRLITAARFLTPSDWQAQMKHLLSQERSKLVIDTLEVLLQEAGPDVLQSLPAAFWRPLFLDKEQRLREASVRAVGRRQGKSEATRLDPDTDSTEKIDDSATTTMVLTQHHRRRR